MMKRFDTIRRHRGFSLTELAIVLIIVALLLGGLMAPIGAQREMQRLADTRRLLEQAHEALLGFAVIYGRLPCPANPATATGAAGAGEEYPPAAGGCSIALEGALPWATLGLPETDAWNRRFTYRVTAGFAGIVPVGKNAAFDLATTGDIDVFAAAGGATLVNDAPAIVVSHGANGLGAFLPTGTQIAASLNADEQENSDADNVFIGAMNAPDFDDQLVWMALPILKNRMVSANKLP